MNVAIVTNDATQVYQRQVIAGIQNQLQHSVDDIAIINTGEALAHLEPGAFDSVDGVLVIAHTLADDTLLALHTAGVPLTLISHQLPGTDIPAVVPDNAGGIAQLVHYLVNGAGRTRIAFITGDHNQTDGRERTTTFRREIMRAGITLDDALFLPGDFSVDVAVRSVQQALANGLQFDALAAADYLMAQAAVNVLREAGVSIPEDVAVVGIGDGPEAADAGLTTAGINVTQIGIHAARQLLAQLHGSHIRGITRIATSIVHRSSTPQPAHTTQ
ncbi:MAG: substrate-binding domain-containing protein [Chloroflexota bacterium]